MQPLKFLKTTFFLVAALTSLSALAGPPAYSLLKNSRPYIQLPAYSLDQKKLVLDQARIILTQIYIHRELKIKDFGPAADPLPALNKIESQLDSLTDQSFHKQLSDIFYRLHDLHTMYYLPKPFACYQSFLPFGFKEVTAANGKKVIAISSVRDDQQVLKYMPQPFNLKIGDIVTMYNDQPVEKAIQAGLARSFGANPSAMRRHSIENLRFVEHDLDVLPANDSVKFEIRPTTGEKYKIEIPWITYKDWSCIASDQVAEAKPASRAPVASAKKNIADVDQTGESTLYWQINHTAFGNFAYLELSSFDPIDLTPGEVVTKIKSLLQNELKDTDGLMIDLRGNTGGRLPIAERMIQLFSPRAVQPHNYTLRASEANSYYLNNTDPLSDFTLALNDAIQSGKPITEKRTIDSVEEVNDLGQVYFKPVAVYVDSKCYSACDTFAAQVQDHQVGTIFGEDKTTGGGGANVFTLDQILEDFEQQSIDPGPFKKLPHGQNILFAFRQAFRVGVNKNMLIEDAGVKVDRIASPNMTDLFDNNNDQILVLENYLKEQAPKYTSSIYLSNEERQDFKIHTPAQLTASWNDTTALEFKLAGATLERRTIARKSANTIITVPAAITTNKVGDGRFELYGSNAGKNVWRKVINYRVIPESTVIALNTTFNVSLKDTADVSLYTNNTLKKDGWNISNDSLYLGNGTYYSNMSHAEASLFITLPLANYELSFDATVNTEPLLDHMKVIAIYNGVETTLVDKLSGSLPLANYKANLSQFAGKAIEIRYVFESDPETTDKGVTIKNISIAPAVK